jgi:hypothetical protein
VHDACAQIPSAADTLVSDMVAGSFALSPEESFVEARHERLVWFTEHPLDLNAAGELELTAVPGVMPADARRILQWRSRVGAFLRTDQLRRHGPEGERLYSLLAPFVTVRSSGRVEGRVRSRFSRRSATETEMDGAGSALPGWREYHRITLNGGGVASGEFTLIREPWQSYSRAFLSGNLTWHWDDGIVDRVVIGDLAAEGAHGLVFGQMRGWVGDGGSAAWSGPMHIEPFHGSYGTRMVRGAAVTKALRTIAGVLSMGAFFGRTPFTASVDESGHIRSLELRETDRPSANANRAVVHESTAGARLVWNPIAGISFGASGLWTVLSRPWTDPGAYGREGGEFVWGCDASAVIGYTTISAEAAAMKEGYAFDAGVWFRAGLHTSFCAALWYCSPGFRNGKGGSSARGGDLVNDAGIQLALSCVPLPGLTIRGTLIRYRRPWCMSTTLMPPSGTEFTLRASQKINRVISLSGGVRSVSAESWERSDHGDGLPAWGMMPASRRTLSASVGCTVTRFLRLETRIDHVSVTAGGGEAVGWLMSQELHLTFATGLRAVICWNAMQTDGYASRVYVLERDVAGAYSAPALSGTGSRWYILLNASVIPGMALSARCAETSHSIGPIRALAEPSVTLQCDLDLRAMTGD